jgi:glycosyltransferase involved in cell wall biosynthesis
MNKISVITVVYNDIEGVEPTICSVLSHKSDMIEYIIIDGGSTDGTVDVIKKYDEKISFWLSEPDNGIYDAMNKGLKYATGNWSIFINVGDLLTHIPSVLFDDNYLKYDAVLCAVNTEDGIVTPLYNWQLKYRNTIPHQGLFYNTSKTKIYFDTIYRVYADYDLNLKMYLDNCKMFVFNSVVAFHSLNGISCTGHNTKEFYAIVKKHNGLFFLFLSFLRLKYLGVKGRIKRILR